MLLQLVCHRCNLYIQLFDKKTKFTPLQTIILQLPNSVGEKYALGRQDNGVKRIYSQHFLYLTVVNDVISNRGL